MKDVHVGYIVSIHICFSMGRNCLTFIIGNTREIFGKNDKVLSHALILSLKRKPNVLGIGIAIFIKRWLFYP